MPIEVDVIKALSDETTLNLFKTTYLKNGANSDELMKEMQLNKRSFYTRIKLLQDLVLVIRSQKYYFPSNFGRIVYHAALKLDSALNEYENLKALDCIDMEGIPKTNNKKYSIRL